MIKVPALEHMWKLVVLVGAVVVNRGFWVILGDARRMGLVVQAWREEGPHTTVLGKVRAHLCTARWLGPLKPDCPRDPLMQCGVTNSMGWRGTLSYLLNLKARLACLEEQAVQAQLEHNAFVLWFMLALCCLVAVVVCGVILMVRWCRARPSVVLPGGAGDSDVWYPPHVEVLQDSTTQPKRDHHRIFQRMQRLKLALQGDLPKIKGAKAPCIDTLVQKVRRDPLFRNLRKAMHKTPLSHDKQDTKAKKVSVRKLKRVFQRGGGSLGDSRSQAAHTKPGQASSSLVQLSLAVPSRLQEWLILPENGLLDHLTSRHSVQVLQAAPRDILYIKGTLDNVTECSRELLFMLDVWFKMEQEQ